jgi:hypothetical protein
MKQSLGISLPLAHAPERPLIAHPRASIAAGREGSDYVH